MQRLTFLFALLLLIRCSKVDSIPDSCIGKWQIYSVCQFQGFADEEGKLVYYTNAPIAEGSYTWLYPPQTNFQIDGRIVSKELSIQLEITNKGKFIYRSDFSKDVTFKLLKLEKSPYKLYINHVKSQPDSVDLGELYIAHLRAKNGQMFEFKFIYDEPSKRLITVGWYDGIVYRTTDRPIVSGMYYGKPLGNGGPTLNIEYLVQFNKD